jgi:hypothetical protein
MYAHGLPGVRAVVPTVRRGGIVVLGLTLHGCSSTPANTETVQYGVLRAAGVAYISTADDFKAHKTLHDTYAASGVAESDMVDGASVVARTQCCRPDTENSGPVVLYNQQHLPVSVGDFVEFRVGGLKSPDHKSELNVITRVLQHGEPEDGACWWEPRNPALWRRIVYCEWMQKEGWTRDDNWRYPGWYKPLAAQSATPAAAEPAAQPRATP